ncbi:hypothetical protein BGZ52_007113 [Haplosporangium bisporale]|nr:hypothetical protein BGZ52_007113 [Haplosporangium bisporale]
MTNVRTIKAALYEGVKPTSPYLVSTEIPAPVAQRGDVVITILASRVVTYFKDMVTGKRFFPSILPMVPGPGAIGIVKTVGAGLVHLKPGQMVFIDPTVLARAHPIAPLATMQGLFGFGEGQKLQEVWRHGSWAEETVVPAENVTVIPPSLQQKYKPEQLIALMTHALDEYVKIYGPRVVPFVPTGDEAKDTEAFVQAAGEGFLIDVVFDMLPPVASFDIVRSAISALRANGTAVLMGGEQANIELPYPHIMSNNITIKGKFMYNRADPTTLLGLADAGLLRLDVGEYKTFRLEEINEAIDWAAANSGPFSTTIVVP